MTLGPYGKGVRYEDGYAPQWNWLVNGISYYAVNQWLAASLQPPHLAAMIPWEGAAGLLPRLGPSRGDHGQRLPGNVVPPAGAVATVTARPTGRR